jgi:hypothetical protein
MGKSYDLLEGSLIELRAAKPFVLLWITTTHADAISNFTLLAEVTDRCASAMSRHVAKESAVHDGL